MFTLKVDPEITLRTFHPDDAVALFDLLERNRPRLRPWIDPSALPETPEAARIFTIECLLNSLGDPLGPEGAPYFGELDHYFRDSTPAMEMGIHYCGELVGELSLAPFKGSLVTAEFGYWITQEKEGRGIIMRSISAMMDYAIEKLSLVRFVITCAKNNLPSRSIPERLGYRLQATIPNGEVVGQFVYDQVVYGIRAASWRERKSNRPEGPLQPS